MATTQTRNHSTVVVITTLIPLIFGLLACYYNVLLAALVVAVVLVVVAAARVAMVAWITVLVALTFSGNRRRVLVKEGRKITAEVGSYLFRVTLSERKGAFTTFACAILFSVIVA